MASLADHRQRRCAVVLALGDRLPYDILQAMCTSRTGFKVLEIQDMLARARLFGHERNLFQMAVHSKLIRAAAYLLFTGHSHEDAALFTESTGIFLQDIQTYTPARGTGTSSAIAMFIAVMMGSVPGVTILYDSAGGEIRMAGSVATFLGGNQLTSLNPTGTFTVQCSSVDGDSTLTCASSRRHSAKQLKFDLVISESEGMMQVTAFRREESEKAQCMNTDV